MRKMPGLCLRGFTTLTDLLVAATRGYGCGFHIQPILHYDRQMLYVVLTVQLYSWIISLLPAESTASEGSLYVSFLSANSIYNWQGAWQPSLNRDCNPYTNGHAEGIFKLASTVIASLISRLFFFPWRFMEFYVRRSKWICNIVTKRHVVCIFVMMKIPFSENCIR